MSLLDDLIDVPEWHERAACRGLDPDLFFPERGESTTAAKAICADCPVRPECLGFALTENEKFGIWGGKSERERRAARARIPRSERPTRIQHGTEAGWAGGCPCGSCRCAHDAHSVEARPGRPQPESGTRPTWPHARARLQEEDAS